MYIKYFRSQIVVCPLWYIAVADPDLKLRGEGSFLPAMLPFLPSTALLQKRFLLIVFAHVSI